MKNRERVCCIARADPALRAHPSPASGRARGWGRGQALLGVNACQPWLVYGGEQSYLRETAELIAWRDLPGRLAYR